ncbi:MAG TPA: alpha/beta fold hydrolase [Terriglobia bacterium]|nr:alpha/beta fold hydrolase [Terriglobia bacterium]
MKNPGIERSLEFPNLAGKTLRGMLHLPAAALKQPAPGVVLFHGFTGNRMESHWMFVKCSRALAQAEVASLRFDFYGSGESDGEFRGMTLRGEIADGRAAVAFLRGQTGIDPERVGLLGLSLGGAVAATLAPSVRAKVVVLWSAVAHTARLRDLIKQLARRIPGKPGASEFDAREISPRFIEDALKVEPIRHLARYKGPTLIIHPEKDEIVPVSHARDFFQAARSAAKELAIIAGADHVYTSVPWEQDVIVRTVQWFGRHL